jgi:hypothetical protein
MSTVLEYTVLQLYFVLKYGDQPEAEVIYPHYKQYVILC